MFCRSSDAHCYLPAAAAAAAGAARAPQSPAADHGLDAPDTEGRPAALGIGEQQRRE